MATRREKKPAIILLVCIVTTLFASSHSIKWCAREDVSFQGVTELQQCNSLVSLLNNEAKAMLNDTLIPSSLEENTFTCVASSHCARALRDGEADLVMMDAKTQHASGRDWGAQPLNTQSFGTTFGPIAYYSVAITTRSFCDAGKSLSDLKVKHTPLE